MFGQRVAHHIESLSVQCRRRMRVYSALMLMMCFFFAICCIHLPPLPSDFSRPFHEGLKVELSADLFDLTPFACKRTAFCQHLVLECAASKGAPGQDAGNCEDMKCSMALPSLAADIQSIYLENLHRQPDIYGIEYYCEKVASGKMSISEIRLRMVSVVSTCVRSVCVQRVFVCG